MNSMEVQDLDNMLLLFLLFIAVVVDILLYRRVKKDGG
jgi:hypothetical protein